MVGRQTSRGCLECRKRKARCDLATPSCRACVKGGLDCPGYADRFIHAFATAKANDLHVAKRAQQTRHATSAVPKSLVSEADVLRLDFVRKLEDDGLAARLAMVSAGHVLKHVPIHIGHSRALDDAVRCLAQGSACLSSQGRAHSTKKYGKALYSLRDALNDAAAMNAPETLAAAFLLQMHEQYGNQPGQKWILHARGVVKMLRLRGLENMTDDIEKAVLEAIAGHAFLTATTRNREGFLHSPTWSRVVAPARKSSNEDMLDRFMGALVDGESCSSVDELCTRLLQDCRYDCGSPELLRERLCRIALADVLLMREELNRQLASARHAPSKVLDPVTTASYAANGFFLIIADTMTIGLCEQLERYCDITDFPLPHDTTIQTLIDERAHAFEVVTLRFQILRVLDPDMLSTAGKALRTILGTIMGLYERNNCDSETLLLVLEQELNAPDVASPCGTECSSSATPESGSVLAHSLDQSQRPVCG